MKKNIKVLYDITVLENACRKDEYRSGIFFVALNLLLEFSKSEKITLFLYSESSKTIIDIKKYVPAINEIPYIANDGYDLKSLDCFKGNNVDYCFEQIDIYFTPHGLIKNKIREFQNIKNCSVLYDCIPLVLEEYKHAAEPDEWFGKVIKDINENDFYFCISNYTKNDFIGLVPNIDKNKTFVSYIAPAQNFKKNKDLLLAKNVKLKYKIPLEKKYFLTLSNSDPRKNLEHIKVGFEMFLKNNNISDTILVCCGTYKSVGTKDKENYPNILYTGYVDDEDVEILYSGATGFIYLSLYEGFGMPPLEAMSCGIPCIVSNATSLPEVTGDAALLVNPKDKSEYIKALEKLYYSKDTHALLVKKSLKNASRFSWSKTSKFIIDKIIYITTMTENKEKYFNLFQFAGKSDKQVWIGLNPMVDSKVCDITHSTNFRASPNFHQNYDCVWFYEYLISNFPQWKIIVDEMIRFIDKEGYLVFRFSSDNLHFSYSSLKHFLWSNINITCEVEWENYSSNKNDIIYKAIFKIKRKNLLSYQSKKWTFGILASKGREDNVLEFLKSIRSLDKENNHEIIISGTQNNIYKEYNVKYDLTKYSDKYAEISKKKNNIVSLASNENIMIVHDRYILDKNFFIGFEKYGYDFDFITIKQFFLSGKEFPSYCYAEYENLIWGRAIISEDFNHLSNTQYLNGGLLIFKKHCIERIKFNEMLFWNQQEDVALSKDMLANSIVPRVNYISSATTIGISENHIRFLEKEKQYINTQKNNSTRNECCIIKNNVKIILKSKFKPKKYFFFSKIINQLRKVRLKRRILSQIKQGKI